MTWEGLSPPYATIVADPPWPMQGAGIVAGSAMTSVRPRYSTMTHTDIERLDVAALADDNAHCYLWAINSQLHEAVHVLEAWGFTYKTALTWVKRPGTLGLGAYFRTQTEHVLFGVRGSLPTLAADQRTYFEAAKRGHSRKPAAFADLVERSSPGPYVDLFCREPRFGWDSWGYGYESTLEVK